MTYDEKTMAVFRAAMQDKAPADLHGWRFVGHAGKPPGQGPYIEISLSVSSDGSLDAAFQTFGCPACIACSEAVCVLARGRRVEEARLIDASSIVARVGELPRVKRHCIALALAALNNALNELEGNRGRTVSSS